MDRDEFLSQLAKEIDLSKIDRKQLDFLWDKAKLNASPVKKPVDGLSPLMRKVQQQKKMNNSVLKQISPDELYSKIAKKTSNIPPGNTLDYSQMRKEARQIEKDLARKAAYGIEETSDIAKKAGRLSKLGKKGLKVIPFLGPILAGVVSQDANAAVPVLSEADPLGPTEGTLESKLESGEKMSPEEMQDLLSRYKK